MNTLIPAALLGAGFIAVLPLTAMAEVQIQEVTSPLGIHAWLVEEPANPFVALEIRLRPGTVLDAPGKRGATNLMVALLEEGAGEMDATAYAEALEGMGASFGFASGDDAISISARMLTENRDEAAALLRLALTAPRFDETALERVRGQVLAGIDADAVRPGSLASEAFYAAAYPDHPYGTSDSGTRESVTALTRDDILEAHLNALTRQDVYVGAVGDISAEELGALLDDILGDLPATGPHGAERVPFGLTEGVTVIDFDTPQSVALFGQTGITRDDPRYFAAYIVNHILGDGMESRLMQEVREKRGLTYGIGTYLAPRDLSEMVVGSFSSSNAAMAEAIGVVKAEWAKLAQDGITQEELDLAKTYLTGEYPLRFSGNGQIADILVGMQMVDLPPDYVIHRNDYIEAVTLEQANRIAAEIYRPDALHFVVVGRPEGLSDTPKAE